MEFFFRLCLTALLVVCFQGSFFAQNWVVIPGITGVDIGIGKNGTVWLTTTDGGIHRWDGAKFVQMPGGAKRLSVAPDGNAWVVNATGQIYRFDSQTNQYTLMDGGATDIGLGANGAVWVIGQTAVPGGFEIYRRNGNTWERQPGGAVRVAVDPAGNAWVVNNTGTIFRWINGNWEHMPGTAIDIGIGADGSVWCTGKENGQIRQWNGNTWVDKSGAGVSIAVGPTGNPWVVNRNSEVFRSESATVPQATVPAASSGVAGITSYIRSLNYDPRQLLSVMENGSKEAIPAGGSKDRQAAGNAVIICTKNNRKITENMDQISILKPTNGVVYPGALILANRKLAEGMPTPITLARVPLTLRIDLPGLGANGTKVIQQVSNSAVEAAMNEALELWNRQPAADGYVNASRSILRVQKAFNSEQLALELGFRAEWAGNSVSGATKIANNTSNEVTIAFFQQVFYTITMDVPEQPGAVFNPSVSLADVRTVMNGENPPAYIRSVDYGRTIMVRMETQTRTTSVDLEAALKYAVEPNATVEGSLKAKYENVLRNSKFTVFTVGGNAQVSSELVDGSNINALRSIIQRNSVYTRNNPGVPIAYTVAFLKDNTTASIQSSLEYVETDCVEYPNGFIKLAHNGGYVGRFSVQWQEPDANGVFQDRSYHSGDKTAGWNHTLSLPGDARNIRIRGEAATGLVWDPWGEAIALTLNSPTNCTYTIGGTTLNRNNSVNCP